MYTNRILSPADSRAENHKSENDAYKPKLSHYGLLFNGFSEEVIDASVAENQHLSVTNDFLNTDF